MTATPHRPLASTSPQARSGAQPVGPVGLRPTQDRTLNPGERPEVPAIRVALVDQHTVVRQGIAALLDRIPGVGVLGEAGGGPDAARMVAEAQPDVVLVDPGPVDDAVVAMSTSRAILEENPKVRVLVFTAERPDSLVIEAVRAGACGFVSKDVDADALVRSIESAARGESAFDARASAVVVRAFGGQRHVKSAAPDRLTPRESDVVRLVARGHSNKVIADRLNLAESTVKFHVRNAMAKLAVSSRTELVYTVMRNEML